MLAAQRATLHGASRALALGPGRSRQRATPRHAGARALCAAIPAAHTCTIAEIFVRLGAAAGDGSKLSGIQQLPAGRQEDLRPQLHQLALAWHAGKGTKDELSSTDHRAPFAVILAKNSSLRQRIAHCGRSPVLLFQLILSV